MPNRSAAPGGAALASAAPCRPVKASEGRSTQHSEGCSVWINGYAWLIVQAGLKHTATCALQPLQTVPSCAVLWMDACGVLHIDTLHPMSCRSSGCGDTSCILCQYNPSRICKRNLKAKYLIDDHLRAKCGAGLRVEVVDEHGQCVTQPLPDMHLEVCASVGASVSRPRHVCLGCRQQCVRMAAAAAAVAQPGLQVAGQLGKVHAFDTTHGWRWQVVLLFL